MIIAYTVHFPYADSRIRLGNEQKLTIDGLN